MTMFTVAGNLGNRVAGAALILALAALALRFDGTPVAACSCIQLSPTQAFERADTVFVGEATEMKVRRGIFGQSSIDPTTVEFAVSEVWKGARQESITIRTVRSEVSCGFEFEIGLKYLVYARDGQTGLCDRTALTNRASEDLAFLGDGQPPEAAPPRENPDVPAGACNAPANGGRNPRDLAAVASVIGMAALSAWRKRGL